MGVPASERARGSVGLEPAIIDHIAARVLDPALQLRCSTVATELDGCKDQAHRPDDDADQARERSDIRRVFEQEKPAQVGRVGERSHRADSPSFYLCNLHPARYKCQWRKPHYTQNPVRRTCFSELRAARILLDSARHLSTICGRVPRTRALLLCHPIL